MGQLDEKYQHIIFLDAVAWGDSAWFCNMMYNALFRLDLETKEIRLECILSNGHNKNIFNQYAALDMYKGHTLIIASRCAEDVMLYDVKSKALKSIPLDMSDFPKDERFNLFSAVHVFGDSVYLFPARYNAIVKIDLLTEQITYVKVEDSLLGKPKNPRSVTFGGFRNVKGKCGLMLCWQENAILEFDYTTMNYKTHCLGDTEAPGITDLVFDGENYWIALKNELVVLQWDGKNAPIRHNIKCEKLMYTGGIRYLVLHEQSIYIIPVYGNGIIKMHTQTLEVSWVHALLSEPVEEMNALKLANNNMFCCYLLNENCAMFCSGFDGKIYLFHADTEEIEMFPAVSDKQDEELISRYLDDIKWSMVIKENEKLNLQDLYVYLMDYKEKKHINAAIKVGADIYKMLSDGAAKN